jgi:hypothetical protein
MLHGLCSENLLSLAECAISPCSFVLPLNSAFQADIKSHDYSKHKCVMTFWHAYCNSNDITDIHFAIV